MMHSSADCISCDVIQSPRDNFKFEISDLKKGKSRSLSASRALAARAKGKARNFAPFDCAQGRRDDKRVAILPRVMLHQPSFRTDDREPNPSGQKSQRANHE